MTSDHRVPFDMEEYAKLMAAQAVVYGVAMTKISVDEHGNMTWASITIQDIVERAMEAQRGPSPLIQRIAAKMVPGVPEKAAKSDPAIGRAITKTTNQHRYTTFWADKPGWGEQLEDGND